MNGQPKRYTVEDPKGRRVTFEWSNPNPPNESDLQQIFMSADSVRSGGGIPTQQAGQPNLPSLSAQKPNYAKTVDVFKAGFAESPEQKRGLQYYGRPDPQEVSSFQRALATPLPTAALPARPSINLPYGVAEQGVMGLQELAHQAPTTMQTGLTMLGESAGTLSGVPGGGAIGAGAGAGAGEAAVVDEVGFAKEAGTVEEAEMVEKAGIVEAAEA